MNGKIAIFPFIYMARCTFPERRQRVHTYTRLGAPFTNMRTLRKFGSQRLLERLCEWLTALPKTTPLWHIAHSFDIIFTLLISLQKHSYFIIILGV